MVKIQHEAKTNGNETIDIIKVELGLNNPCRYLLMK